MPGVGPIGWGLIFVVIFVFFMWLTTVRNTRKAHKLVLETLSFANSFSHKMFKELAQKKKIPFHYVHGELLISQTMALIVVSHEGMMKNVDNRIYRITVKGVEYFKKKYNTE